MTHTFVTFESAVLLRVIVNLVRVSLLWRVLTNRVPKPKGPGGCQRKISIFEQPCVFLAHVCHLALGRPSLTRRTVLVPILILVPFFPILLYAPPRVRVSKPKSQNRSDPDPDPDPGFFCPQL